MAAAGEKEAPLVAMAASAAQQDSAGSSRPVERASAEAGADQAVTAGAVGE